MEIDERIDRVRDRVLRAARRVGRDPAAVRILPITKGHRVETVAAVIAAGFDRIGENRVAEAEEKRQAIGRPDVAWHMVGHVQRNKAARVIRTFDLVESVDSIRLAVRLSEICEQEGREPVPVLVQVNASGEATKGGFDVAEALEPIAEVCTLPGLKVKGMMTMAPFVDDREELRAVFRRTRSLFEECSGKLSGFEADVLSMGMSNDFELAVEEGSTELRLGTILVGERPGQ
ncbi:MAG: YggS family pyridoxal phosphate-dependent enzyme [Gemmatimonadota bacterium]